MNNAWRCKFIEYYFGQSRQNREYCCIGNCPMAQFIFLVKLIIQLFKLNYYWRYHDLIKNKSRSIISILLNAQPTAFIRTWWIFFPGTVDAHSIVRFIPLWMWLWLLLQRLWLQMWLLKRIYYNFWGGLN